MRLNVESILHCQPLFDHALHHTNQKFPKLFSSRRVVVNQKRSYSVVVVLAVVDIVVVASVDIPRRHTVQFAGHFGAPRMSSSDLLDKEVRRPTFHSLVVVFVRIRRHQSVVVPYVFVHTVIDIFLVLVGTDLWK